MGLVANAPARTEILVYWAQYGAVNGVHTYTKARTWLIAETQDPDAVLKLIVAHNDPADGHVVYETFDVTDAKIQTRFSSSIEVTLAGGGKLGQLVAPCVCGAGAVGHAGPTTERHKSTMLNPHNHNRITI